MVPVFLTVKVTSPAGAESGDAVKVIGPSIPLVSPTTTWTVVPDEDAGTVTPPPPAVVFDDDDELPQAATPRRASARTAVNEPARLGAIVPPLGSFAHEGNDVERSPEGPRSLRDELARERPGRQRARAWKTA